MKRNAFSIEAARLSQGRGQGRWGYMEAEKMPLLLFPAILPSKTLFCAVAGGKEKVGGSIKAWLSAFLHDQGKSKARLTWNGQIFKSMWQSEDYCA